MNSLFDVRKGVLYNMDTTFLSDVDYKWVSVTTAVFLFHEEPDIQFPYEVLFQPMGEKYDNISFAYTLTGCKKGKDELGDDCYRVTGTAEGIPEFRNDLRVSVSFPVDIILEDQRTVKGKVTDISAGGFMFVSEEELAIGTGVSFVLPFVKSPAFITGEIRQYRPTRQEELKGYGCQFVNLSSTVEAAIRSFVFHEELVQRKRKVIS